MEYREIGRQIEAAPHGKEKMKLIRKGWELADKNKNRDKQLEYRMDYMSEVVFYDDIMEMYVVYPEILKLYDEQVKECGYSNHTFRVLWQYKWLLEDAKYFHQISVKQWEKFYEDAKKRYIENNYSLRALYMKRFSFYKNIDREEADKAYKEFLNCKRDRMCDCQACERSAEVEYLLYVGEIGLAASKAEALFERQMTCEEQPECTYGDFIDYYNKKIAEGDADYIEPASNLCETLKNAIARRGIATEFIPTILLFYAMTGPTKALNYYKKYWSFYETCRNPHMKFNFAMAAVRFFNNLGDKETYKMSVTSDFLFYNESNTYNIARLKAYYENSAIDIAKKMDARNGNTIYMDKFIRMTKMSE